MPEVPNSAYGNWPNISSLPVKPVHMANALTGEVPLWDPLRNVIWWVDIQGQRLLSVNPDTCQKWEYNLPAMPGLLALRNDGTLLIGLEEGLYSFDPASQNLVLFKSVPGHGTRINDGKPDAAGRLWFGTMNKFGNAEDVGELFCLDLDGSIKSVKKGIRIPNSIAFSVDGTIMYFADSATQEVNAFDYDIGTGHFSSGRLFCRFENDEKPDGACVDAENGVWIAIVNGSRVERRLSDGSLDFVIPLPVSRPTMPMLGGADGQTLFVTSQRRFLSSEHLSREPLAGDLISVRVPFVASRTWCVAVH